LTLEVAARRSPSQSVGAAIPLPAGDRAVAYGLVDEVIDQRRLTGIEPARQRPAA
jgi:hypothetical protein